MILKSNIAVIIVYSIIFFLLIICSIEDIRKKSIHMTKVVVVFVALSIFTAFRSDIRMIECFTGVMVGVVMIVASKVTRGQIGTGDGYMLCVTGVGLGVLKNFEMLSYALLFAAVYSMYLLLRSRFNRKRQIPFIPFLLMGFICCIVVGGI